MPILHTPKGLTPAQKIRLAHDAVFRAHPIALAAVASKWRIVETEKYPTFCTDGRSMYYNPKWCDSLTLGQVACVVLHEITHVVLGHHFRMGLVMGKRKDPRIHKRLNVAADLAINSRLMPEYVALCPRDELESLIEQGCFPRHGKFAQYPELKSMEYYYAEMQKEEAQNPPPPSNPKPKPKPTQGDDGDEDGDPCPMPGDGSEGEDGDSDTGIGEISDNLDAMLDDLTKGSNAPEAGDEEEEGEDGKDKFKGGDIEPDAEDEEDGDDAEGGKDGEEGDDEGEGPGDGDSDAGDDGQGGSPTDEENDAEEIGNAFGSVEPYATDPEEIEEGQKEFERAVTAAIVTDKSWGTKGSWMETELSDMIYPTDPDAEKVDWRTKLREFLTKVCREGYSYRRPSRRHGWRTDCILPAHRGTGNSDGVLIVDTSGSMGDAECEIALRELETILSAYPKATVKMISCDTRVMEGEVYTRNDFPITEPMTWKGRGGTDLAPAFEWVRNQPRNTFDWCVILSDMEWYWQGAPDPGVPTIWLACRPDQRAKNGGLPFGEYVEVKV